MADLKISQLTGATTPLAGTEVVPLVQSGTTKKVAVSDLTAGRAVSVLSLTATDLTASSAVATDANKKLVSVTNTGTGNNVLATSPTLTTPNIGVATATSVNSVYQKVLTASLAALSTKTLTITMSGHAAQFQIVADVGGNGAGSLILQAQGLLSNSNYYSLVESGKKSYLNITMGSGTAGNGTITVSIVNAAASAGTVTVLGTSDGDFSIAVA
jgi:hypothetical protein